MFTELLRKLRDVDEDLSLAINLSKDNVYTISVDGMEMSGYLYSYSSTDLLEVINRVDNFIEALTDNEKFEKLLKDILEQPIGV